MLTTNDIRRVVDGLINRLIRPNKEIVITLSLDCGAELTIGAYFTGYLVTEGDNISSPYYSDYEDVEVEITEASAIGEDNEEYTIPDSDLDKITEQIAQRI